MRFVVFPLLLLSTSAALAQSPTSPEVPAQPSIATPTAPATPPAEEPATASPPATNSRPSYEDIQRHTAKMRECISQLGRGENPVRNSVRLKITIRPYGAILGDPEVIAPLDSDDFRNDVAAFVKRLHECEPFKIGASDRTFTQEVTYAANTRLDKETLPVVQAHFRRCRTKPQTGPEIVVAFKYNKDGTYAERPRLLRQQDTPEYAEASTTLIEELGKCPAAEFSPEKYYQWASFTMRFTSREADQNAARPASPTAPPDAERPPPGTTPSAEPAKSEETTRSTQ